jgi:hypothetical protein
MDYASKRQAFVRALADQKEWRASRLAAMKTDRGAYQQALETQLATWRERLDDLDSLSAGGIEPYRNAAGPRQEAEIAWQRAREELDSLAASPEDEWPDRAGMVDEAVDGLLWKIHELDSALPIESDALRLERVEAGEPAAAGEDQEPLPEIEVKLPEEPAAESSLFH